MTITLNDIIRKTTPCTTVIVYLDNRFVAKCTIGLEDPIEAFGDYLRWEVDGVSAEYNAVRVDL